MVESPRRRNGYHHSKRTNDVSASASSQQPSKRRKVGSLNGIVEDGETSEDGAEGPKTPLARTNGAGNAGVTLIEALLARFGLSSWGTPRRQPQETASSSSRNGSSSRPNGAAHPRRARTSSSSNGTSVAGEAENHKRKTRTRQRELEERYKAKSRSRLAGLQYEAAHSPSSGSGSTSSYSQASSATATTSSSRTLALSSAAIDAFSPAGSPRSPVKTHEETDNSYRTPPNSFADYRLTVNNVNSTAGKYFAIPSARAPSRKTADILKQQHRAGQIPKRQDRFDIALRNAKQAIDSPKPATPPTLNFDRLRIKDEKTSLEIAELSRRRRKWPTRLNPEMQDLAQQALRKAGTVATLPAAEVTQKDIARLRPSTWLNDEVINFYGVMVNLRSAAATERKARGEAEEGDEELLDIHVFSSHFYAKLTNAGYAGVKRWTKKFDLFKKDIAILPVNLGNAHWVCAAINIAKKRLEYYDSMGNVHTGVLDNLRDYLKAEHLEKKKAPLDTSDWTYHWVETIPQQSNGFDCGVFTSQFIECLSRKGEDGDSFFDFSQAEMPYLRLKMIAEIMSTKLAPEEWM